jgi:hypothetical protein
VLAIPARFQEALRQGALAQQVLAEPKSEALLADTAATLQHEAGRQPILGGRRREPMPQGGMSVERAKRHAPNMQGSPSSPSVHLHDSDDSALWCLHSARRRWFGGERRFGTR